MARKALFLALAVTVMAITPVYAYEFKLLNGMKVKGELKSFDDGRFFVETDFGQAVIDADRLDYIIVEETDPGPSGKIADRVPGIGLGGKPQGAEKLDPMAGVEAAPPVPLAGYSVTPAPLENFSIDPAMAYPGVFRGGARNSAAPDPLGNFSIDPASAYPGLFRGNAK